MAFLVGGANSASGGYEISNSLRFNNNDTAYLNRTRSSQSNTTATFSVWTKMGHTHNTDHILFGGASSDTTRSYVYFSDPNGAVGIFSETSDSTDIAYASNGIFKDSSAWYHVVLAIDTTDGTAGNRFKMYINGTQYTDWATATAPSQNAVIPLLGAAAQTVGGGRAGGSIAAMAEGYMADCYYIDGQQKAASDFGETDDNGVWIPKKYTGTFGTNGFKLEFKQTGTGTASASTIGADTSGEDNHLTSNNLAATDVTVDTPTNNFCTLNPLSNLSGPTLSEGNTEMAHDSANDASVFGTFGVSNGKWYWELKGIETDQSSVQKWTPGVIGAEDHTEYSNRDGGYAPKATALYLGNSNVYQNNNSVSSAYFTATQNDIIQIALDADNNKIYFGKNGTYGNSGDPTSGATGTGAVSLTASHAPFIPHFGEGTGHEIQVQANFGNAPFAISSGNSDANGYGNFEYAVPSGFYALCTKNLAKYG